MRIRWVAGSRVEERDPSLDVHEVTAAEDGFSIVGRVSPEWNGKPDAVVTLGNVGKLTVTQIGFAVTGGGFELTVECRPLEVGDAVSVRLGDAWTMFEVAEA